MLIPKLTLDTNLLQEYWKEQPKFKIVEQLIDLAKQGKVDLAVTRRIQDDIPKPPLSEKLNDLPELNINETGSVTRLDFVLGRDLLGDEKFGNFHEPASELAKKRRKKKQPPPDWRDWDHLHAHYLLKRDIFLSWDGGIVCLKKELKDRFGILVMKPEEFLEDFGNALE